LAAWVEKLFETSIPAKTLETRAYREEKKLSSNEDTPITALNDSDTGKNLGGRPLKYYPPMWRKKSF
jgi:hypothetical protein